TWLRLRYEGLLRLWGSSVGIRTRVRILGVALLRLRTLLPGSFRSRTPRCSFGAGRLFQIAIAAGAGHRGRARNTPFSCVAAARGDIVSAPGSGSHGSGCLLV